MTPVGVPGSLYLDHLQHLSATAEPGTLFEPDFEAVAALEPDPIVIGGRSAAQFDALSALAPTIDMTITGETSATEEARQRLEAYATLFDREDVAAALAGSLDATLAAARAAAAEAGDALVVMTCS